MPGWLISLYVLVTSRVPFPRGSVLFAIVAMTAYLLFLPWRAALDQAGLPHPATLALMSAFLVNLWNRIPSVTLDPDDIAWTIGTLLVLTVGLCAFFLFAPSLIWIQHAYSVIAFVTICGFLYSYNHADGPNAFLWVGRNWKRGQRNAANWFVANRAAAILINESLIRYGTPTDWLVGITLGNVALHYLMYWTILATHPYDGEERDQTP